MNKLEYKQYQKSVADFFRREGINCLTTIEGDAEPYFSWQPCDCCGSPLGGDRYDCHGYNPETKEIYEYSVCPDCLYYDSYGQLDDMTMMEIKDSAA